MQLLQSEPGLGWAAAARAIGIQGAFKVHLHSDSLGVVLVLLSGVALVPKSKPGLGVGSFPWREEDCTGAWHKPSPTQRGWRTCKAGQPMGPPTLCLLVTIFPVFFSL